MKRIILLLIMSVTAFLGFAQDNHPVSWKIDTVEIGPLTYELKMKATVKEPWHIYTQQASKAGLAMPTQIIFEENSNVELIGATREKGIDQENGQSTSYYSKEVTFTQTLKLKSKEKTNLNFTIKYMACNDQMCLPPTSKQFSIILMNNKPKAAMDFALNANREAWLEAVKEDNLSWTQVLDLRKEKSIAMAYAVTGIPDNVLIDPNGIIIATKLRGEALQKTLEKILK